MKQRIILATTHIDRHSMRMTREALEGTAEQINHGSRPLLTVEHDLSLPPYGKVVKAWVEPRDDGEYQLVVENEIFDEVLWTELSDGTQLFKQESNSDRHPFMDRYTEVTDDVFLSYDWTNFDSEEDIQQFLQEINSQCHLEFTSNVFGRKSYIPDPEFLIGIAKAVGAYLIARKVLDKSSDKVLELVSEDVAKVYTFMKAVIGSAVKYVRARNRPITYVFVAQGNPTLEFIARSANASLVVSSMTLDKLEAALSHANFYYSAFEAVRIQYLLNSDGKWEFNFLLTNTGAVIGTEKSLSRRTRRFELLTRQREAMDKANGVHMNLSSPNEGLDTES